MTKREWIASRKSECSDCGRDGTHVDAIRADGRGDIVEGCETVAAVHTGTLLAVWDGDLLCDACADVAMQAEYIAHTRAPR